MATPTRPDVSIVPSAPSRGDRREALVAAALRRRRIAAVRRELRRRRRRATAGASTATSGELVGRGAERTGRRADAARQTVRRPRFRGGDRAPLAGRGEPALEPGLPEAEHAHDDDQLENDVSFGRAR